MVLFDEDNELDDEEIRKLLKRGLKKKEDLDVDVAQDFFGIDKEKTDESADASKQRKDLDTPPLISGIEDVSRKLESERKIGIDLGGEFRLEKSEQLTSEMKVIEKTSEADLPDTKGLEDTVEQLVKETEETESMTELEMGEDENLLETDSVDVTFLVEGKESRGVEGLRDEITTDESSVDSLSEKSTEKTERHLENAVQPDDVSVVTADMSKTPSRELEELRIMLDVLYQLLEVLVIEVSRVTTDRDPILNSLSRILVSINKWNDIDDYPNMSNLYTELSRLRNRVKRLSDQSSLITKVLQDLLPAQVETQLERYRDSFLASLSSSREISPKESEMKVGSKKEVPLTSGTSPSDKGREDAKDSSILDEEIQIGQFHRAPRAKDYWSYIVSSGQLMESYQHISDIVIPLYWRYALIEIHRYRIEDPVFLRYVIKIPAESLNEIVRKLLREAPTSRLLQRIKQKRLTDQLLSEFLPNDLKDKSLFLKIRQSVERYLEYFTNVQKGILSFQDVRELGEQSLKSFELGPNEIETRIPLVALNVLREIRKNIPADEELRDKTLDDEQYLDAICRYLTIYLVNELNRHFINESKFFTLLERLKQS